MTDSNRLRAIDLYSGMGGWSLGLNMAGIEVVASYEWWSKAARTNKVNNGHVACEVDIRELALEDLPENIDIVVGSPPCTQFSFANRGGQGNIEDGLRDVEKFLEIVEYVKPKFWAMENVPRTADIITQRLRSGGTLERFSKLLPNIIVVDMSEWGLPQGRKRCIIGNFDIGLLYGYQRLTKQRHLRDVVEALDKAVIYDPIYGIRLSRNQLTDHRVEDYLSVEEARLNREGKAHHPIYNNMSFPDLLDRPSRTITATCTRVSRESIVIEDLESHGRYRRLSVRERGCLQGFPITYQFYGDSYAEKLKMIGNAVPPLMTFYIAQAMLERRPDDVLTPREAIKRFNPPSEQPALTLPDKPGSVYPRQRRFRLAIPGLRFKSGVRFELSNESAQAEITWSVGFYFGDSKNIQRIDLNDDLLSDLQRDTALANSVKQIAATCDAVRDALLRTNSKELQNTWTHVSKKGTHPFDIVDRLGRLASDLEQNFENQSVDASAVLLGVLQDRERGINKILRHSNAVLAGLFVGSAANSVLHTDQFLSGERVRRVRAN
ncbi:MAG: DNA cytosine methyltransferase [Pyrinomonadaceae bacterium]